MIRRKIVFTFAIICFIAGCLVIAYPHINQYLYNKKSDEILKLYDGNLNNVNLSELYNEIDLYNKNLYKSGQVTLNDAWSYEKSVFDLYNWGIENNMIGYIEIEVMNIKLPIYLGATEENMKKGAVHLTETSMPIGGINTNSVIAAHRGYSKAAMFRDIQKLELGDEIKITNPWQTLTYIVVETKVILPIDIEEILIQEDRDLITLITCHPYRHNYQRYVVYCERSNT